MSGFVRKYFFWIIDFLTGSIVLKNLKEIKKVNESNDISFVENYQTKKIFELLEYTKSNIPFYKNIEHTNLDNFPVIDKLQFKENIDDFCSSQFKKEDLYKTITSGSTGTPFVSFQNKDKKKRNTADTLYLSKRAGFNLGEPLFYLKIWSDNNKKSKIIQFLQNIIPVDVIKLSKKNIEQLISKIKSKKGKIHINGYSSALEEVCKYLDKNPTTAINDEFKVGSILAQSEALTDETKEKLYKYFKCLPCSRYSNLENGIVAQQTLTNNNIFLINRASYKIEILKIDSDAPVKPYEVGRIVLTDLFNYAMPFIRYDTGDIGKFVTNDDDTVNFKFFKEIEGRKLDILFDTSGNMISSYIMYKNMFKYPEIDQFQLIQEEKNKYEFVISMRSRFEKENELKNEFLEYLGKDANFEIKYVDEIPLLSSGKRRKIVNNYLKKNS